MTREIEELDWLCRLRSAIYVYMPKEWLIPMNNALDMAIKALEQESCNLDDAREDFMHDVYNTLDSLPTNEEANRIIDSFDRVTSGLKQDFCEDCISRADAKKYLSAPDANGDRVIYESDLDLLPPVQPKHTECDDAISRSSLLGKFDDCYKEKVKIAPNNMAEGFVQVEKLIKQEPPVTPKPKMGHWIVQPSNEEQGERPFIWWKCSNCGQVIFSETTHDRLEFHAFCGRCGARMVKPQESEK